MSVSPTVDSDGYEKTLSRRQVQMIAIGGGMPVGRRLVGRRQRAAGWVA